MISSVEKLQFFEDFSREDIFQPYPFFRHNLFTQHKIPIRPKSYKTFFLRINWYKKQTFNHSKRNLSKYDIDAVEI